MMELIKLNNTNKIILLKRVPYETAPRKFHTID
jgi:hypothetical protein